MEKPVSEILFDRNLASKDKKEKIEKIKNSCDEALQYLSGEYKFCPQCKDYYRKKSFEFITETKEEKVCVYRDIINSGGDEYENQMVTRNYYICPKNHRIETNILKD